MAPFFDIIIQYINYLYFLLQTDWAIIVPVICELIVIGIKTSIGDLGGFKMRFIDQLIDAPTDLMAIILGYVGGLIIAPGINIKLHWEYTLLLVFGMNVVWYLNRLNRLTLKKLSDKGNSKEEGKKETVKEKIGKLVIGFKLALFFFAMYIIPIISLAGTSAFLSP